MTRVALALLLALALLPVASAHVESYSQSKALRAGPFLVFFDVRPTPPHAEMPASVVVQISDAQTGAPLRDVPARVVLGGPDYAQRKDLQSDGTGYQVASVVFPHAGNYSARVFVKDPDGNEHANTTEFEVFPNLPFRIRPVDMALDVYTGVRTPIALEVVDPSSLQRKDDAFSDLTVRVEHWTEDHSQFLGAQEIEAQRTAPGIWRIDHVFQESGMHHLRFASRGGGFNYADVPLLHVYALSPQQAGLDEENDTPGPALALLLGPLALAALARRRR